jgi:hypothetical protein
MFSSNLGVVHDGSGAEIVLWYIIIIYEHAHKVAMHMEYSISVPTQITIYLYRGGYALHGQMGALKQAHFRILARGPEPDRLPALAELQQGPGQKHSLSCCDRHMGCV